MPGPQARTDRAGTVAAVAPDDVATVELDGPVSVRHALTGLHMTADVTRQVDRDGSVWFTGRTPLGPVTVHASTDGAVGRVEAWGDGAGWMTARADRLLGSHDDPRGLHFDHPVLDEVNRRNPGARHGATGLVVDTLLARTLGQRVLVAEASRSWRSLCDTLGDPAPGPRDLRLPPLPSRLAEHPTWWFHQHGVERGRATILVEIARRAARLDEARDLPLPDAYRRLRAVRGIGPWTANGVARVALGDPDAITVGDFWITHAVVSFFTGRPRGTDEEMLALVARWAGQRGRVERLISLSGHRVARFGPGIRTPRITRL